MFSLVNLLFDIHFVVALSSLTLQKPKTCNELKYVTISKIFDSFLSIAPTVLLKEENKYC